ncbi:cadmium-translocating P-type ATPase [Rhodobacteraceae bacterium B1Z28]|uniref:Cadmium-translocating P-type ATPase n=1 Tax=Ruegeria haliotis TaxID=2747601 RepID=A0ABX2PKK0_9RHOB|nr:heavy metal translocating P-type ATPase [Ruegeria haliotis]NVO54224.1 cadmium-translocating P-type ATPase [Ruegeria haliotis]
MADLQTIQIEISGMSCASCVARVETALRDVPGVETATVNFATETAQVTFKGSISALTCALDTAGYPAATQQTVLKIDGMNCASCVSKIERALASSSGVVEASVNLATESATVTYVEGSSDLATLAKAVTAIGYSTHTENAQGADPAPSSKADEIDKLTRATVFAAVLALPVFILEMGGHMIPAFHHWVQATIGVQNSHLIQFALTSALLIGPGRMFYTKGVPSLLRGAPDMNALVAMGTGAAYLYSVAATFAPQMLPQGTANVYFEAAAVIVVLILLGRLMEARAKGKTGAAIRKLVGLQPKTARIEQDGATMDRPIAEITVGDILQIRPGERVPVDGEVLDGTSYVDESMITGEPVPIGKSTEDQVVGGTVNGTGALRIRATRVGADTVLAQVIQMVEQAQGAKLPIQGLVDRITYRFVPAVIATAALAVIAWLIFGPAPAALPLALVAGVSVLIIACPCAMGLATPTSIMVGTGRAAELGVLFRKGDALQQLQQARVIALDKTGTLTLGRPELDNVTTANGFSQTEVLRLAAALEARSEHPIARAITRAGPSDLPDVSDIQSLTGLGLQGTVEGRNVLIGSYRLMQQQGVDLADLQAEAEARANDGATPLFMAIEGQAAASLAVSDPIKPGTREALAQLHEMGMTLAMVTGDNIRTAQALADRLRIDHVTAEVLPDGKLEAITALRDQHGTLAFVGDGINDAPALAAADIGIAIGTGTDVAIETADVVLMSGDLRGVANALEISRRTMRNIRQNLGWAFGYNILLIPVAAGALYPFGGHLLSPALAAGAMALSSVFVVSNALRLRRVRASVPETTPTTPEEAHA